MCSNDFMTDLIPDRDAAGSNVENSCQWPSRQVRRGRTAGKGPLSKIQCETTTHMRTSPS